MARSAWQGPGGAISTLSASLNTGVFPECEEGEESPMKSILASAAVLLFVATASAEATPIKVRVLYNTTNTSSSAVGPLLIQKFAAQPALFTVVNDNERNLSIIVDCYIESANRSYSCYYAANKWLGSSQASPWRCRDCHAISGRCSFRFVC